MDKAKVFWSGRSQAVRVPKKYRFETGEVSISRQGRAIVLEPLAQDWDWLDRLTGPLDDDFVEAVLEGR
ncbi:antitoxin [Mesorhizobium comanense]|uniref:antitoxin n=1 Tax=Mesorhizobium comanense TaxID=2502215 RepID=UPI0010F8DC8C|nr:type II toxin-antitoxin system VapB family antitoxin [Mesorhizobium comanense]